MTPLAVSSQWTAPRMRHASQMTQYAAIAVRYAAAIAFIIRTFG